MDFVCRPFFLMQRGNRVGHEVHRHDVDTRGRTKGKRRKSSQENEGANHVKLIRLRAAAISQHDTGPENRSLNVGQQLPDHVFAEFLCACVRVVIRAVPIDRRIFLHYFVQSLPRNGHGAHVAEPPKPVMVARARGELNHLQRAAQVYVQAAFL